MEQTGEPSTANPFLQTIGTNTTESSSSRGAPETQIPSDPSASTTEADKKHKGKEREERHPGTSFDWLRNESRGSTYISYSPYSSLTASSFEFGDEGYVGATNLGGELLYMAAPSEDKGLVFARGIRETSLYACLARAQRVSGAASTFGLEISTNQIPFKDQGTAKEKEGSSFRLGSMTERGCFNYRWRYNEYELLLNQGDGAMEESETGICKMLSFVKDGVLYQVLRIEERDQLEKGNLCCFPDHSQIALEIGGPVWFQPFREAGPYEQRGPEPEASNTTPCSPSLTDLSLARGVDESAGHDQIHLPADGLGHSSQAMTINASSATPGLLYDDASGIRMECKVYQVGHTSEPVPLSLIPHGEKQNTYKVLYELTSTEKSATFVAAFRMRDVSSGKGSNNPDSWPPLPLSSDIFSYIGVSEDSAVATGVLWGAVFPQEENLRFVSGLPEVNMIGRCLEQILQVDIVPAPPYSENQSSALISNMFLRPSVDLESLFWKVRFLVKIHKSLHTIIVSKEAEKGKQPTGSEQKRITIPDVLWATLEAQSRRIQESIQKVVLFLITSLFKPEAFTPFMPDNSVLGNSSYYYVTTTIWYVVKNCTTFQWSWKEDMQGCLKVDASLSSPGRLPPDNWNFEAQARGKAALLKWYHYLSELNLRNKNFLPGPWVPFAVEQKVQRLARAAMEVAASNLSVHKLYTVDDEIIDRLVFLAGELGLEESSEANTIQFLSMRRIARREPTRQLYPGWVPLHTEKGQTSSPWEIHALCHHSRLKALDLAKDLAGLREDQVFKEADACMENLSMFLNSEVTLVSSWERSHSKASQGWLLSEVTAVLVTTLLDMRRIGSENKRDPQAAAPGRGQDKYASLLIPVSAFQESSREPGRPAPINWRAFQPPRKYHPENFMNSLDDTPQLYKRPYTEQILVPISLRAYAPPSTTGYTQDKVKEVTKLGYIGISDILATGNEIDREEGFTSGLSNAYAPGFRWRYGQPDTTEDQSDTVDTLKTMLYDSLVDQEVQHRMITVKRLWPTLVELLVYVIHTEAATCLSNHVLKLSRFSYQRGESWVMRITVKGWSLAAHSIENDENGTAPNGPSPLRFLDWKGPTNDELIVLPLPLHDALSEEQVRLGKEYFDDLSKRRVLRAFSLVLSTNPFGDFSKCTIFTDHFKDTQLASMSERAREVWQKFTHQPQSGRCLVFLLILGDICNVLASEYDIAIEQFTKLLSFDAVFLNQESQWAEDYSSLDRFKLGLWGLDSLSKLQSTLAESLASVIQARDELVSQIIEGPGKRSEALERMCEDYLDDFESSLAHLTAVGTKVELRIELSNRYKDALSSVLALRDSRVSLNQNSTVQRLTYLTIGYLPMAFITAVWAIPGEQNTITADMGLGWFIGAIMIMSAVTYLIAVYIGDILAVFPLPSKKKRDASKRQTPSFVESDWRRLFKPSNNQPNPPQAPADVDEEATRNWRSRLGSQWASHRGKPKDRRIPTPNILEKGGKRT